MVIRGRVLRGEGKEEGKEWVLTHPESPLRQGRGCWTPVGEPSTSWRHHPSLTRPSPPSQVVKREGAIPMGSGGVGGTYNPVRDRHKPR